MQRNMGNFATCPITQGCLLRFCLQFGNNPGMDGAKEVLSRFTKRSNHVFLPDDLNFLDVPARGVRGHKQVTDAYLAALAKRHGVRLATFDRGLAILLDNVVELIPT